MLPLGAPITGIRGFFQVTCFNVWLPFSFYGYGVVFALSFMSLLSACDFLSFVAAIGKKFPLVKGHS